MLKPIDLLRVNDLIGLRIVEGQSGEVKSPVRKSKSLRTTPVSKMV